MTRLYCLEKFECLECRRCILIVTACDSQAFLRGLEDQSADQSRMVEEQLFKRAKYIAGAVVDDCNSSEDDMRGSAVSPDIPLGFAFLIGKPACILFILHAFTLSVKMHSPAEVAYA